MRRFIPALALIAVPAILAACDPFDGLVCTTEFVYGLRVTVVDAATNAPVDQGLEGTLTEGTYVEEMEVVGLDGNILQGAGERAGTYTLEIRADGYETFTESGIVVTENECHVNPVSLLAELTVDATGDG